MRYILGITIMILVVLGTAFGQCSDADKKALEAFDHAWGKAGDVGDKAALMNLYADDYVGMPGNIGKAATVANTMADFERNKASGAAPDNVTADRYMISCSPVSATITHRNIVSTQDGDGGKPQTFWSRSVHFLEKRGGKWQVVTNASHNMDDFMAIDYLEQDWNDAILTRDSAWFEANLAQDYSGVSSENAKLMNKADEIADTVAGKGTIEFAETTNMSINIDRDFARVTGVFHWKGKDEKGTAYENKVRYIDTWIRRDGRWQVWSSAGTRMQ